MVHWEDPAVIGYVFFLYEQIAVFLLGFYGTQLLWSMYIEWELITRKRAFRVVHIPWLLARYVMLSALLFFVITGRSRSRIACDVAYRTFASLGSGAAMLASWTLCSRPAAILYTMKQYIPVIVLILIGFGQAIIVVLQGILSVRAHWDTHTASCEVFSSDNHLLGGFYIYTFCFDVVILAMTLLAVHRVHMQNEYRRWRLGDALCVQGIWYVAATCAVNVPVATLAFLNLNPGMNVLLSLPAVTISVIASSLTLFAFDDYYGAQDDASPRPGTTSRPSELVSRPLPGSLTTHISMDIGMAMLDSRVILDDDLRLHDKEASDESASPSPSTAEHPPTPV